MKITVKTLDDKYLMQAVNEDGNTIQMDSSPDIGGQGKGMRPMQLLLAAIGGCSTIDVLLILKKQKQIIDSFEIEVEGERQKVDDHSLFKEICLIFKIKGQVDYDKLDRAIKLSLEKYCSVAKTLEPTAKITYKISINNN